MTNLLDQILDRVDRLDPQPKEELIDAASAGTRSFAWVPNPGPQSDAYFCQADELFYGGQAGGGKTDLGLGLALTAHRRSLVLRRVNKDAVKLVERCAEILGHRSGYSGQLQRWRLGDRLIEFSGCEYEEDKQRFKGDPHDLIYFDEGTDFLASQYRFIIGWNRSVDEKQRCRVVVGSNPPTTPEGLWVIKHWAPWLDPRYTRGRPGPASCAGTPRAPTARTSKSTAAARISSMANRSWRVRAPTLRRGSPTIPISPAPACRGAGRPAAGAAARLPGRRFRRRPPGRRVAGHPDGLDRGRPGKVDADSAPPIDDGYRSGRRPRRQ